MRKETPSDHHAQSTSKKGHGGRGPVGMEDMIEDLRN
jgi:hypothetical protein